MSTIETMMGQPMVIALSWALIHFIWQGTLVALLLAGILRLIHRRPTNARYAAACIAMLLMMIMPLSTMAIISQSTPDKSASKIQSVPGSRPELPLGVMSEAANDPGRGMIAAASPQPPQSWTTNWSGSFMALLPWVIIAWLLGVVFFSLRLVGAWLFTQRLVNYGTRPLEERWQESFQRLCRQLSIKRPVSLLESALVKVPTAIGWLRPVILLPASALTGLSPQQLEAIIAHELAHIRRYDYLINLLQAVIETLLFYHPAVWWVSRRIRQEREHCCDDLAVAVCGDVLAYARALIEMEQLRVAQPQLAVSANGGSLMNRIHRLVGVQTQQTNRFAGLFAGIVVIVTVVGVGVGAQILLPSGTGNVDIDHQLVSGIQRKASHRVADFQATVGSNSAEITNPGETPRVVQDDRAAEALVSALRDPSWKVRKAAVESLAELDGSRSVELLIAAEPLNHALQDTDTQVRKKAAEALGILGGRDKSSISAPGKLLISQAAGASHQEINLQRTAAEGMKALTSSNPVERAAGACSLGRLGAVEAIPALIGMLGDSTPIQSVKCWDGGNWSPALHTFRQASPGEQAAIALASMGQPALEPLIAALYSASPGARTNAAWAIGEIRGGLGTDRSAAVEPLIMALSDADPWVRVAAAFSLGEMRPRHATEPLIAVLEDANWNVREMAARALGEMKTRRGVERLAAALLQDGDERVRRKAAWALGEIRDPHALDALTAALTDQDQRVRATAKWAIAEIRD